MTNTMILISRSFHNFPAILDQNGWWVKIETEELLTPYSIQVKNISLNKYISDEALNTIKSNDKMNRNTEF